MLGDAMTAVRGGGGSDKCNSYIYDDRGLCLATYTCPKSYTCLLPLETEKCIKLSVDTDCFVAVSLDDCRNTGFCN